MNLDEAVGQLLHFRFSLLDEVDKVACRVLLAELARLQTVERRLIGMRDEAARQGAAWFHIDEVLRGRP